MPRQVPLIPLTMRHIAAGEPGPPDVLALVGGPVAQPTAGGVGLAGR